MVPEELLYCKFGVATMIRIAGHITACFSLEGPFFPSTIMTKETGVLQ